MRKTAVLLLAVALSTALGGAAAQSISLPPVEELMSLELMELTGLSKLTPQELAQLNVWLTMYAQTVVEVYGTAPSPAGPTASSPARSPTTSSVVESRIEGTFEGWDGDTVFTLTNGQIWRQAEYDYHYHYAYMPKVTIIPSGGRHLMQVDGVRKTIAVTRIR